MDWELLPPLLCLNPPKGSFGVRTTIDRAWISPSFTVSQSPEGVIWRPDTLLGVLKNLPLQLSQSPEGVIWRPDLLNPSVVLVLFQKCLNPPKGSFGVRTTVNWRCVTAPNCVSIPRRGHLASGPRQEIRVVQSQECLNPPKGSFGVRTKVNSTVSTADGHLSQSPEGVIWRPDEEEAEIQSKIPKVSQSPEGVIWRPDGD